MMASFCEIPNHFIFIMFTFTSQHSGEICVPTELISKLKLFERHPGLDAAGKYTITSDVDRGVIDLFFERVMGKAPPVVTAANAKQLRALCDELGFSGFDDEIRGVLGGDSSPERDPTGCVDKYNVIVENLQCLMLKLERQVTEVIDNIKRETDSLRQRLQRLESKVSGNVEDLESLRKEVAQTQGGEREYEMEGALLDGIIRFLSDRCWRGGNVHDEGIVIVTASSVHDRDEDEDSCEPDFVTELGSDSCFISNSSSNEWICYNFKGRRLVLTSYSIRGGRYGCPSEWVIEVSKDGSEGSWEVVDERHDQDLCEYRTYRYKITTPCPRGVSFVRFRKRGRISLSAFEIFGEFLTERSTT